MAATTSISSSQKTIDQIVEETAGKAKERNTGELGKDDFLNLLVTQLRYQDPLNPTSDKEFIGQMAQFSSLEQMQNVSSGISSVKAFNLIGKKVTGSETDEKTGEAKAVEGYVSSVKMSKGKTYVVVNGKDIAIENISEASDGVNQGTDLSKYTNLIGYKANGFVYDSKTGDIVSVSGKVKSVQKGVYEDYAVMDGVSVQISEIATDTPSTAANFMENYLKSHNDATQEKDKVVNLVITDSSTGKKVTVSGVLNRYQKVDGRYTAVLDKLNVPVEGINNVSPTGEETAQEALLKKILDKLNTQSTTQQNTAGQG